MINVVPHKPASRALPPLRPLRHCRKGFAPIEPARIAGRRFGARCGQRKRSISAFCRLLSHHGNGFEASNPPPAGIPVSAVLFRLTSLKILTGASINSQMIYLYKLQ